jgi:hypothetical protein
MPPWAPLQQLRLRCMMLWSTLHGCGARCCRCAVARAIYRLLQYRINVFCCKSYCQGTCVVDCFLIETLSNLFLLLLWSRTLYLQQRQGTLAVYGAEIARIWTSMPTDACAAARQPQHRAACAEAPRLTRGGRIRCPIAGLGQARSVRCGHRQLARA